MKAILNETLRLSSLLRGPQGSLVRLLALTVTVAAFASAPVRADEQSELIQKLLQRIDQLEKKVESLDGSKAAPPNATPASDKSAVQELDQKIRVLERKNELAAEDAAAK